MRSRLLSGAAKHYVIVGAGAAGLSLCFALLERGTTDPITILDQKPAFSNDRTWCFWNSAPHSFSSLANHCWHRWEVTDTQGRQAAQSSSRAGYACLQGLNFYAYLSEVIRHHPNVTLRLGSPVDSVQPCTDGSKVAVVSGGESLIADYVFDSRPHPVPEGGLTFFQHFFGQFVRTDAPVFDPTRCTLMDFRVSQGRGLHFMYLLPFSPTEALLEDTYIQPAGSEKITPEQHRQEITDYFTDRLSGGLSLPPPEVLRQEAGMIPMTTQPFPQRDGRIFFIGTAGGCSKPSSGYTFARIQQQCRQIADAAQVGALDRFQAAVSPRRYRFFDTVFLQAMQDDPEAFPGYFYRLFSKVPPDTLTAFLTETGTWRSDFHILRSLPLRPFLTAALRAAPIWAAPLR